MCVCVSIIDLFFERILIIVSGNYDRFLEAKMTEKFQLDDFYGYMPAKEGV